MSSNLPNNWHSANQRYLVAALGCVRAALEPQGETTAQAAREALAAAAAAMPAPSALAAICTAFELTPFERNVLLLCAAVELDASFGPLIAAAQGDRRYPTFGLALAMLPEPHWSALAPAAPLRRWRLIELDQRESLMQARLRIDERVLHELAGVPYLDERLHGLVVPLADATALPPSQEMLARRVAAIWRAADPGASWPLIQLNGSDQSATRDVAAAACALASWRLFRIRSADLPSSASERDIHGRLWAREAALSGAALLIEDDDALHDNSEQQRTIRAFAETLGSPLLLARREPLALGARATIRFDVTAPTTAEQQQLWQTALGPLAAQLNGQIAATAAQFSLGPAAIRAAATVIQAGEAPGGLWETSRHAARQHLDDLAQRIEPAADWDDLVLPDAQRAILREIAAHVRRRSLVYHDWGFAGKSARGLGISALFAGASGTGKTMAAEVLAGELQLDLYRIDLSAVVSKYIGETEKNLRRVFDAAESSGAILLFDEADALFGKRSDVKDSHDRYANIEVSYLLQRMEAYRGLAILTTNMKQALDQAFLRRIRFVVQFPFPDASQRAEIWRRIFPLATPTTGLEIEQLSRLNLAGGNIRNVALGAAFLAADEGTAVGMQHLLRAARAEYAKLEKPLSDAEVRGWRV